MIIIFKRYPKILILMNKDIITNKVKPSMKIPQIVIFLLFIIIINDFLSLVLYNLIYI